MSDKQNTIYAQFDGAELHATAYYRLLMPIIGMSRLEAGPIPMLDNSSIVIPTEERQAGLLYSDFTVHYHQCDPQQLMFFQNLHGNRPRLGQNGTAWYPPVVVADTDDDLFRVMPLNPAFRELGTVNPYTKEPLGRGCKIEILLPLHQEEAEGPADYYDAEMKRWKRLLWEDGKNGFDIQRNLIRVEAWRRFLRFAQLITCSTPRAADYVKRENAAAEPFVAPNIIDFDHYPQDIDLLPHPSKVRILWQGSQTHHECLWPLVDSFLRVAKKYPNAEFVFWGNPYRWLTDKLGDRARILPWCPYPEYKPRRATIGEDINLCPLGMNEFNDSRSAIKAHEASAQRNPSATLAQRWGAYRDELIEGETALLFDTPEEFELKLGNLIEDAALRKTLGANAKQWVRENCAPDVLAPRLWAKYSEVLEAHKQRCGPPMEIQDVPVPAEHNDLQPS